MIKNIVFDFGGVLIEWSAYNLYRKLLPSDGAIREFLEEINFSAFNKELDAGYSFSKMKEKQLALFPQHRELVSAFFDRWNECIGDILYATVDILRELKAAGYPVFGLSNWSHETFPLVMQRHHFLPHLNGFLLSGYEGVAKPDAEIYHLFLERFNLNAEESLFIDDAPINIEAARRIGFTGIVFTSAEQLRTDLEGLGILSPG